MGKLIWQIDLKALWDGHLARPDLGGQDAHPTRG